MDLEVQWCGTSPSRSFSRWLESASAGAGLRGLANACAVPISVLPGVGTVARLQATNAYGWPRIVITVFGVDMLGRNVTHGYGSMLIPIRPGTYERYVDMYAPMPSSLGQRVLNFLTGNFPEYYDANFVAQGA